MLKTFFQASAYDPFDVAFAHGLVQCQPWDGTPFVTVEEELKPTMLRPSEKRLASPGKRLNEQARQAGGLGRYQKGEKQPHVDPRSRTPVVLVPQPDLDLPPGDPHRPRQFLGGCVKARNSQKNQAAKACDESAHA